MKPMTTSATGPIKARNQKLSIPKPPQNRLCREM